MSDHRWSPIARLLPAVGLLLLAGCAAQPATGDAPAVPGARLPGTPGSFQSPRSPEPTAGAPAGPTVTTAGLAVTAGGYWLDSVTEQPTGAVRSLDYLFRVLAPDGSAVTTFRGGPDTARAYAVRSDLTGFRRVVPAGLGEGVWSAPLGELDPGRWRIYLSFAPSTSRQPAGRSGRLLLGRSLQVPGAWETSPLDPPSDTASVDGFTVHLSGSPVAGRPVVLRLSVDAPPGSSPTVPLDGAPAQLTAVHPGDLALVPFTPLPGRGTAFRGTFPEAGDWRLFVQFRTERRNGDHTAALTVTVRP
ncbi:hypothetical protein [Streptacidiphilus carbonis]|uniref:hypothetical protein n=1 Tax=Streptacidiphilus carbonis TaxID=105422 RepID=UPI000693FFED|nr:hypothetical protein [Streptacidiphilus carbonis]